MFSLPERTLLPLHPPDAVHAATFAEDQVNVVLSPGATPGGKACNVTLGEESTGKESCLGIETASVVGPPPPQPTNKENAKRMYAGLERTAPSLSPCHVEPRVLARLSTAVVSHSASDVCTLRRFKSRSLSADAYIVVRF